MRSPLFLIYCIMILFSQSDAIFWLDKPKDAVSLHDKLPVKPLSEDYKVDGIYKIVVTEVGNNPTPHRRDLLLMLFFYRNRSTVRFSSGFTSARIRMCSKISANSYRRYHIRFGSVSILIHVALDPFTANSTLH